MTDMVSTPLADRAGALPHPGAASRFEAVPSLVVGLLLLLGVLFYVWQHIQVVRTGYEIERLRQERAALVQRNREMTLEIGQLTSLRRVEEVARKRLGMVRPGPGQVILVP